MVYKNEILKFAEIGIINGYEDPTFRPKSEITRTEFLKVILKSYCYEYDDQDTTTLIFQDVDKGLWQARVIAKAQELGIINGDTVDINKELIDTNLGKQYDQTRIEELKKVLKGLGIYSGKVDGFYSSDLIDAVYEFQLQEGIVSDQYQAGAGSWGPSTRAAFFNKYTETSYPVFRPNDVISKAEAVKILMRMSGVKANKQNLLGYSDITTDWHIPYVRTGQTLGLFSPEQDNSLFGPDGGVTREAMVHLISELVKLY